MASLASCTSVVDPAHGYERQRWKCIAGMGISKYVPDALIVCIIQLNHSCLNDLVTRKHIIIAAGMLIAILTILLTSGGSGISRITITSSAVNTCSNSRLNPHHVKAPTSPNVDSIISFWPAFKKALDDYGRDLPSLERPGVQYAPPTSDMIRHRTNLLTPEQASLMREQHAGLIRNLPAYPSEAFSGRGIVMLAGGHYSEYAATALGVLRESGSKLPVEVWRRDEREEKHEWCDEIEQEGMACRRLSDYLDTDILSIQDGKEMKIFTMLFSSFEEIIFIDADNMALQPPELLFESKQYQETGAILWPDYWRYDNIDWLDYIVGISGNRSESLWDQTTVESGQIVWHKRQHWKSLLLATYYNWYGPDLYFTLINYGYAGWGDKDTFPIALRALNESYHAISHPPATVWVNGRVDERRLGMIQVSPQPGAQSADGNATSLFLHATTIKWSHRDFLCLRCLPIWNAQHPYEAFVSRYEDPNDELYGLLQSNQRIIDKSMLQYLPSGDAEVKMWRAMHHAACFSRAWRHARACEVGRRYMWHTFGFRFVEEGKSGNEQLQRVKDGKEEIWIPKIFEDVCLLDPP